MARPYFTLLIHDPATASWTPEFGDYSRSVVDQERRDSYPRLAKNRWSIICTTDTQRDISNMVAVANGRAAS